MIVVVGHVLVSSSTQLANGILTVSTTDVSTPAWLLLYSPLHILWAGNEAVIVFFVLSGYVLALPYARGATLRPEAYYPQRLLRLYVPVWAALCLAAVVHVAIEGASGGGTWWLVEHTRGLSGGDVRENALLLDGAGSYSLLAVLWSLHWEVLFSLLLPLFLLAGRATRRLFPVTAAVALGVVFFRGTSLWADYLPPFALGTLLAFQHGTLLAWRERLAAQHTLARFVEAGLLGAAVLGLTATWWLRVGGFALVGGDESFALKLGHVLVAAGATAAVVLALVGPTARRLLDARPVQWAGARSYSLYLVHEPVIVALAFALGGAPALGPYAVIAPLAAFVVAEAFYRAVEHPSHELARRSGARLARLRRA